MLVNRMKRNDFDVEILTRQNSDFGLIKKDISDSIDSVTKALNDFKKTIPVNIEVVLSREEYDKAVERTTENWEIAKTIKNHIIVFHPDIIESETCHKKGCFKQVLTHELTHVVINSINRQFLYWVSEGLAQYYADPAHKDIAFKKDDFSYFVKNNFYKNSNYYNFINHGGYELSYWIIKYLVEKYGKCIGLKLIKVKSGSRGKENIETIFNKNDLEIEDEIKTALKIDFSN